MSPKSIVVLEPDASWSAEVENAAGPESHIVVLGRRPGESAAAFERRARERLESLASERPTRGVLVRGAGRGMGGASRNALERALTDVVQSAGGGEVLALGAAPRKRVA
ncbi:MAG: hypothetical protein U0263_39730 [Polyangiaceae bacterium]